MVALNVIKRIQSLEARLSENHDKLLKTAEIAHYGLSSPRFVEEEKSYIC